MAVRGVKAGAVFHPVPVIIHERRRNPVSVRLNTERHATFCKRRLPPARVPQTKPPWSFAVSRPFGSIFAYSSTDSGVRIMAFNLSHKPSKAVVLFDHFFAWLLCP